MLMDSLLHLKYETSNQHSFSVTVCVCARLVLYLCMHECIHNLVSSNLPMELLQSDLTDSVEYVHKYAVHARVVQHSELY